MPEKAAHYSRLFIMLTLFAWIVTLLPFPIRFGLILVAAAAGAAGIAALVEAFKTPGLTSLRVLLFVGAAMAAYLGLQGLGYLLVAPEVLAYDDCMKTALTPEREHQCEADFRQGVSDRYGVELP